MLYISSYCYIYIISGQLSQILSEITLALKQYTHTLLTTQHTRHKKMVITYRDVVSGILPRTDYDEYFMKQNISAVETLFSSWTGIAELSHKDQISLHAFFNVTPLSFATEGSSLLFDQTVNNQ